MPTPRARSFTAITGVEGVRKAMKLALPSSKKMIQAGFSYNKDTDTTKGGFPYLQYKYTRTLMNDFTFAMQIVANMQYACKKDFGQARTLIEKMSRKSGSGTIYYLVHPNEKKGLLHRKYAINAQKLSDSLNDSNGFRGLLDIIYTKETVEGFTTNGERGEIVNDIIKKLQIKAKRMTNWITNGPDVARAIYGVLKDAKIINPKTFTDAEVLFNSSEYGEVLAAEMPMYKGPAVKLPDSGGFVDPKLPEITSHEIRNSNIWWPECEEYTATPENIGAYLKIFDKNNFGNLKGNLIKLDKRMGFVPTIDSIKHKLENEEFEVAVNVITALQEKNALWKLINANARIINTGTYTFETWSDEVEKLFNSTKPQTPPPPNYPAPTPPNNAGNTRTEASQTSGSGATSPIPIYWPKGLDTKYLDTYKKLFVFDNQVTGFLMANDWEDTTAKTYAPILFLTPTHRFKSIFDDVDKRKHIDEMSREEKQDLLTIFRNIRSAGTQFHNYETIKVDLAGFTSMFIKEREVTRGIGGWIATVKSGIRYLENDLEPQKSAQTASPLSKPVPAGVNHTLRDLADNHLQRGEKFNDDHRAVNPYKREKKFTAATLPTRESVAREKTDFDHNRRFYMTDGKGHRYRKGFGGNDAHGNAWITDKNSEKLREYFSRYPEVTGAKLECDVVFEDLEVTGDTSRLYVNPADTLDKGVHIFGQGAKADVVSVAEYYLNKNPDRKVLCLDAANEYTAGGAAGSAPKAAEESLCLDTSLYQSLTGGDMDEYYINEKGKPFSYNPCKFSIAKGIRIFRRPHSQVGEVKEISGDKDIEGLKTIDIMVHASPNFNTAVTKQRECETQTDPRCRTDEYAKDVIRKSANQMIKAAVQGDYDVFVINNLGGGVFLNSVTAWAEAWNDAIQKFGGNKLIIAFALFNGTVVKEKNINKNTKCPLLPTEENAGKQISEVYRQTVKGAEYKKLQ